MMMRTLGSAVLLLSLTLPALAQAVIIVDAAGGGDFTEIQPAVDAARVGGLIRIRHGVYPEDVIIRRGIRLIGDRWLRETMDRVRIEGSVSVFDLPANQSFVGTDLLLLPSSDDQRTFIFENCLGNIHLANSAGHLELRNCSYVSTDLFIGGANGVKAGAIVEDSFLVGTNSRWETLWGTAIPMEVTRSKVILVKSSLLNINFLQIDPPLPAIVLTDSELIYTGDVLFFVNLNCDPTNPFGPPCPPPVSGIRLVGSSTAEKEDSGASAVVADIHEPTRLQIRYGAGNSSVFALVVGFPIRPVELPTGTLTVDIASSALLHLCAPPPVTAFVRIDFFLPPGNRFGIPITFQAAAHMLSGEIKLSIPLTIVF